MQTLAKTLLITMVFTLPALAAQDENTRTMGMMHDNSMMDDSMMSHDHMAGMHQRMEDMHTIMQKISEEQDPDKRKALVQEHMQMVNSHMGDQHMSGEARNADSMKHCLNMMQKHMNMTHMDQGSEADT